MYYQLKYCRAKKLERKGMFGKADPYVLVQLGDQKLKSKTVTRP